MQIVEEDVMKKILLLVLVVASVGSAFAKKPSKEDWLKLIETNKANYVVIKADNNWIPLQIASNDIIEGSILDYSNRRGTSAPAGKHGRVVAKGDHFEFEKLPGVKQRFYGINVCGTANTPSTFEKAQKYGRMLAKVGYNAIRFHHHERHLTKSDDGTTLDPEQMKAFDALVYACIQNGLYMTTDLFVSRRVPYRMCGIDKDGVMKMDEFKSLVMFHEGTYSNLLAYSRNFLNHVNEYTKIRYADEASLAWISILNEGNLGNWKNEYIVDSPYVKDAWCKWLAEKKKVDNAYANVTEDFPTDQNPNNLQYRAFTQFYRDAEENFAKRIRTFMREEMNCKALLTNMNSWHYPAAYQELRANSYDYVDTHFYYGDWIGLRGRWGIPALCSYGNWFRKNTELGIMYRTSGRILNRPFTISEYNYSALLGTANCGGLLIGTMAALQDWSAMWKFAWSHSEKGLVGFGTAGRYNVACDPRSLAMERAVIDLFLRRDVKEHEKTYAFLLPTNELRRVENGMSNCPGFWTAAAWYGKFGSIVGDKLPEGMVELGRYPEYRNEKREVVTKRIRDIVVNGAEEENLPPMANGQVCINKTEGSFKVSTAKTCGGFIEKGKIETDYLTFDVGENVAAVWVSSADDKAINKSKRLLLTHLTGIQNTDMTYADKEYRCLVKAGKLPHLLRNGSAKCELTVAQGNWKVYSLSNVGERLFEVPSKYENGKLYFEANVGFKKDAASYLYEIVQVENSTCNGNPN